MRKIFYYCLAIGIFGIGFSCSDDDLSESSPAPFVSFADLSQQSFDLEEGVNGSVAFTIVTDSEVQSPLTVNFDVTGTAIGDSRLTFPNGMSSVTIEPGTKQADFIIDFADDTDFQNDVSLTVVMTSASDSRYHIGYATDISTVKTINFANDDCPNPYGGSKSYSNAAFTGDGSGNPVTPVNLAGTVDIEFVSCDATTIYYNLSDITFGLYPDGYGADPNPGAIIVDAATGDVTIDTPNSQDVVYGGDEFFGTGSFDAGTGILTINWSNGYGDQGTASITI